ncbi:DUF5677 domain-containing protein [Methanosarcina sp. Z-7115]|uniref:DUF5677 domain-containing protein n=1 Tax=Methanosarcina baikalica TaxID=3073890 RepID=A0ABU2CY73_9EURY|nr:DUF5677 domain-containing protein [Methanosarcina sp. Z-7115]MDR7664674.1 DUF5677 domain-containing protein [Methanosarcina sp. Z-7115]
MKSNDSNTNNEKNQDYLDLFNIPSEVKEAINQFHEEIINNASDTLRENYEEIENFKKRVNNFWKKPLDLLDLLLIYSRQMGSKFNKEMRTPAEKENDYVFLALTRLHAKACLVSQEIAILMKHGYASGAHARWRSLHEIAVTALFIKEHGNEVAERYLNYRYIESYYAMRQYKVHAKKLNYEPLEEEEEENTTSVKNFFVEKYGSSFENPYGWASKELNKPRPTFADIEKSVGVDHMRPYYKMASNAVHADSKGTFFNIGLSESDKEKILLAGSSDSGLADPGSGTAVSMNLINSTLITSRPNAENLILLQATSILVNEIDEAFFEAHRFIEEQTEGKALHI